MAKRLDLRSLILRAGGTNRVARECGVTSGAVSQWLKRGQLPLTEIEGKTSYAATLIRLSGASVGEWEVRLIGRR